MVKFKNASINSTFFIVYSMIIFQTCKFFEKPAEISQQRFEEEMVKRDDVDRIVIITNLKIVEVYIKGERLNKPNYNSLPKAGPHFYFTFESSENLEIMLGENDFNNRAYEIRKDITPQLLMIFISIFVVLWLVLLIDILKSNFVNSIDKLLWFIVISFIPVLGFILYLSIGRKQKVKATHNS